MELKDKRVYLTEDERTKPKKITGTRLGAVLGFNAYSTPFQAFCEITHTWESPFEDSIYTLAGKAIEPKQAEYVSKLYPELKVIYPKDQFGEDFFSVTHGNFFEDEHFGGMWDYLGQIEEANMCVFEMKTAGVSKKKDWNGNKIPESYALQASLYAWLLGIDTVRMVATFLNQNNGDYNHPENFIVSDDNTVIREFKVSEKYPTFRQDYIEPAIKWWNDHIVTGISPEWDEVRDAEILEDLRNRTESTSDVSNTSVIDPQLQQLDNIVANINQQVINSQIPDLMVAKRYYMQLPILIYNISTALKELDDNTRDVIKVKIDSAKLVENVLENIIRNPNQFKTKQTLNE